MGKKLHHNLTRKAVPVLAYLPDSSLLQCSFNVKYCESPMKATLSLQSSFPIDGFDNKQSLTLIYDADNLVGGKTTLCHNADREISPQQQLCISKEGRPLFKTLSLALKHPCLVQCSSNCVTRAPYKSTCSNYQSFVQLARAKEIKILIDYKHYHKDTQDTLDRIIQNPRLFCACPFDNTADQVRQTVLSVFGHAASDNQAVSEHPPPPYINASNAQFTQGTTKRLRQASSSEPPEYPSLRRGPPSPLLEKTLPGSTLSPKLQNFSAAYEPNDTPSPTVANSPEPTSLPNSPYLPDVDPNKRSSASIQGNNAAWMSIYDTASTKFKLFTQGLFVELDNKMAGERYELDQAEEDLRDLTEECKSDLLRTIDEQREELEAMLCRIETEFLERVTEIKDEAVEEYYPPSLDVRSSEVERLVLKRFQISQEEKALKKKEKKLKKKKASLKQRKKELELEEKHMAKEVKRRIEEQHQRNVEKQTLETDR